MLENIDEIVAIYQDSIDTLIDKLGKNVKLVFKPTVQNVSDELLDPIRDNESKKPSYKVEPLEVSVENYRIIKALIKHTPKEYINFGLKIEHPENIVRLKTYLTDIPDLLRAEKIITNYDSEQLISLEYRILMDPVPAGLKEDRYAISFWERI